MTEIDNALIPKHTTKPDSDVFVGDPLTMYTNDLSKYERLLTYPEEVRYANILRHPRVTPSRRRWVISQLFGYNAGLVISIARKYYQARGKLDPLDLIQAGNDGLIEAAEEYDPEKGLRFSTFAYYGIRRHVSRVIQEEGRTIRVPVHMLEKNYRAKKAALQLILAQDGEQPSLEQIAHAIGKDENPTDIDIQNVEAALHLPFTVSTEKKIKSEPGGRDLTLGHILTRKADEVEISELAEQNDLREIFERLFLQLNEKEQHILLLRFGWDDDKPKTLKETAKELLLSNKTISKIEQEALEKLNRLARTNPQLSDYAE